jgi:small-conductance mechanosensitive channel
MNVLQNWLQQVRTLLDIPIFRMGQTHVTLWSLLYLLILFLLLVYVSGKIRSWIVYRLLLARKVDLSMRMAVGAIFQYFAVAIGLLIILQTAGIDLTTLNVLAGAFGIGIGLGLQNIANNFVSGLIILFERPIKIGDRIEVAGVEGDVAAINARSTTVITNDNIAIIVPNSKFIGENVINWSYTDRKVRFKIPVTVAYGSDPRQVERLLLEAALEKPDVMRDPAPAVRFLEFGDSGLHFEVRAWTDTLVHRKGLLFSSINFAIHDKFKEHGIEIPYPKRDLHFRSGQVEVKLVPDAR